MTTIDKLLVSLGLGLLLLLGAAPGLEAQADARSIIRLVDEKNRAESARVELTMLVYPYAGNEKDVREYQVQSVSRGEEESHMVFVNPRSIKGLAILSIGDDQWVYFPSTGRVRKIAGKSKEKSVEGVGGDFSYEDLGGGRWEEKYDFSILADRRDEWVLAGKPVKESAYSRIEITIDKKRLLATRVDYYKEGRSEAYKELLMSEVKSLGGRDVPTRIEMRNLEKRSRTVVITHQAQYDLPVDEKYFNPTRFYR